jgi:hypothetical protein
LCLFGRLGPPAPPPPPRPEHLAHLRAELVQVAAVCVAWREAL